jgi:hypothetical protein
LNNIANDYLNDYVSGVEDYNPDTVIKYNIIVYDGLKTSSSHVDLSSTAGTSTSMTNTQVSIAPITAGKPTLNVNDVLNKYIPNVNESEFPQYIFQTTAGPQYTNVSVYSADNSRLLFSFRDIYGTNPIYFNRLYGLFVFKFEIIDKNLKLISKTKNIPNLKSISAAKPESNLNLDFGVVDIETFVKRPEDESGVNKVIPYAIGVYYKGEFKSFYLSDYAETPTRLNEMFDDFIDYITDKNIKTLYAHNGGKFDF